MSSAKHIIYCPKCNGSDFREEKIVELDASVVIRDRLEVPGRTSRELYRYTCVNCGEILDQPWTGHHD
jgi:hypothetical protein